MKSAIESLRLTPVMFELGARPHPPRTLYHAYLDQSEIFVGIYWQSGGWTAKGSDRSGLEDEFNLAQRLPRLIYVKEPSPDRDERLTGMLERIRADAEVSYRPFASAEELAGLVADDLAHLISERFQHSLLGRHRTCAPKPGLRGNVPAADAPLVDRADELAQVRAYLLNHDTRLVTLTGPGGVGKTRLAIEAARVTRRRFPEGTWLVPLDLVRDPGLVPSAILECLHVPAGGHGAADALKNYLRRRRLLLILDNFEQTLSAAGFLADLLSAAPALKILVTSRAALHVRAEHEVPISPLQVPPGRASAAEREQAPAVRLFLDRARAVRPDFTVDAASLALVATIVRRLDGLPLAIELAASRCRMLSPQELLEQFAVSLDVGGGGLRDLPDRQRSLRATIQWSFDLLEERQRRLLLQLSVFRRGFTLDGARALSPGASETELLDSLEVLVDSSLILRGGVGDRSRYGMLAIVGEFAAEKLVEIGLAAESRVLHAGFISHLVAAANSDLFGPQQNRALRALERESANVEAALDWYLESGDVERLAELAWGYWSCWWFYGRLDEGGRRSRAALDSGTASPLAEARLTGVAGILGVWHADQPTATAFLERSLALFRKLGDTHSAARVLVMMAVGVWASDPAQAAGLLTECQPMFSAVGDRWGLALCANVMAWLSVEVDDNGDPTPYARQAFTLSEASGDDLNVGIALGNLGTQERELGQWEAARKHLAGSIRMLSGVSDRYAMSSMLASVGQLASLLRDPDTGIQLLGAAQGLHDWLQEPVHPAKTKRYERAITRLRAEVGAVEFERLFELGKSLDYDAAVGLALTACEARRAETAVSR